MRNSVRAGVKGDTAEVCEEKAWPGCAARSILIRRKSVHEAPRLRTPKRTTRRSLRRWNGWSRTHFG